jgi:hypothetical protein
VTVDGEDAVPEADGEQPGLKRFAVDADNRAEDRVRCGRRLDTEAAHTRLVLAVAHCAADDG